MSGAPSKDPRPYTHAAAVAKGHRLRDLRAKEQIVVEAAIAWWEDVKSPPLTSAEADIHDALLDAVTDLMRLRNKGPHHG